VPVAPAAFTLDGVQLHLNSVQVDPMDAVENDDDFATPTGVIPQNTKRAFTPSEVTARHALLRAHVDSTASSLSATQRASLERLLCDMHSAISLPGDPVGTTTVVEHSIELEEERAFRQQLRRHPDATVPIIAEEVGRMLKLQVVEPSNSAFASNVIIVWKTDGKPRFCVDYRQLNAQTRKDAYPLPVIQELYRAIGGASWFTTMDLESGFWQV
jgi:hypothetical protein